MFAGQVETYKNLGKKSNVSRFQIGDDFIIVFFNDGAQYLYNQYKPGPLDVAMMKALAVSGSGLNTFIKTMGSKNYAQKLN